MTATPYDTVTKLPVDRAGFVTLSFNFRPSSFGFGPGTPVSEANVSHGIEPEHGRFPDRTS